MRTPWRLRARRWRTQLLPVLVFACAATGAAWLWQRQSVPTPFVGQVESSEDLVRSGYSGRLVQLPAAPGATLPGFGRFSPVQAGQVIARFDESELAADAEVLRRELAVARADQAVREVELQSEQANARVESTVTDRRFERDREALELERLILRTDLERERLDLALRQERVTRLQQLGSRLAAEAELDEAQLKRDRAMASIRGFERSIAQIDRQIEDAKTRRASFESATPIPLSPDPSRTEQFAAELAVWEARLERWAIQRERLFVVAPRSGVVTEVLAVPGQWLEVGAPLVRIEADVTREVVGYLTGERSESWRVGAEVELRGRSNPRAAVVGYVSEIGPAYAEAPSVQRPIPTAPVWGLPVRITFREGNPWEPGELVDFRLRPAGRRPVR